MGNVVGLLPYAQERRRSKKVAANERVARLVRLRRLVDDAWRYRQAVERRRRRLFTSHDPYSR
jgi:hypothetical protein